jgi:hypothetical protein
MNRIGDRSKLFYRRMPVRVLCTWGTPAKSCFTSIAIRDGISISTQKQVVFFRYVNGKYVEVDRGWALQHVGG